MAIPPINIQQDQPVPPLFTLPPELYPLIIEQLGFEDRLALKLSCKDLAGLLGKTFQQKIRDHIVSSGQPENRTIADILFDTLPAKEEGSIPMVDSSSLDGA